MRSAQPVGVVTGVCSVRRARGAMRRLLSCAASIAGLEVSLKGLPHVFDATQAPTLGTDRTGGQAAAKTSPDSGVKIATS
jgi:hypothetical protein